MYCGIAFGGKMGSGKTECADYLVRRSHFKRTSFADAIKELAEIHQSHPEEEWPERLNEWIADTLTPLGYSVEELNRFYEAFMEGFKRHAKVEPGKKNRELLQYLGTEAGRSIDPEVWIKILTHRLDPNKRYVIDDVRFGNELEALRRMGFWTVYLDAPSWVRFDRIRRRGDTSATLESVENHPSETELDKIRTRFHQTLYNDERMSLPSLYHVLSVIARVRCGIEIKEVAG